MNKQEKQFKKEYLEEKLHLIGDRLNDAYGEPLLEELINRMEKTVSHFNEEVDSILESIKSRTQNQHYKLASLRGEDPIKEAFEEDNKKLTGYILDIISSCQDLEIEIGTLEEIKKDLQI